LAHRFDPVTYVGSLLDVQICPEDRSVSTSVPFRFPFTPPEPHEVEALARAADYLLRAANEVESSRLLLIGFFAGSCPLDDLPAALSAAGHLCDAVIDSISPSP
jgi:hypothetical protein